MEEIHNNTCDVNGIARTGSIEAMAALAANCVRNGLACPWDETTAATAAHHGHKELLVWLRQQSPPCPWDEKVYEYAARGGHLNVLEWALSLSSLSQEESSSSRKKLEWSENAWGKAARHGHLEVLKWAYNHPNEVSPWKTSSCCQQAAYGGHLHVLKWLRSCDPPAPWCEKTCSSAALKGNLECLQFARLNGCPWNGDTCARAARNGHLEVLQWARSHGCEWDERTCSEASAAGHLHILSWTQVQTEPAPLSADAVMSAAANGQLEILKWLRDADTCSPPCPWDHRACQVAAENSHFVVLKWLRSQSPPCPWRIEALQSMLLFRQQLDVLEWLEGEQLDMEAQRTYHINTPDPESS